MKKSRHVCESALSKSSVFMHSYAIKGFLCVLCLFPCRRSTSHKFHQNTTINIQPPTTISYSIIITITIIIKYSTIAFFVAIAVTGSVNAAFFNPTLPFQHEHEVAPAVKPAVTFLIIPRRGSFDSRLDNAGIEADGNITPSRK